MIGFFFLVFDDRRFFSLFNGENNDDDDNQTFRPPRSATKQTTHHLNGAGEAGTDAALTMGAVESTGAGPRAWDGDEDEGEASLERRGMALSLLLLRESLLAAAGRGAAALRGASAGRVADTPEGARRTRDCISRERVESRGEGGEGML